MKFVAYRGEYFYCNRAVKGVNYIRLYDENNILTTAFEGISDFSDFIVSDGKWEQGRSAQRVGAHATLDGNSFVLDIKENVIIEDGLTIYFDAPANSEDITSIIIGEDEYSFVDAANVPVNDTLNCFDVGAKLEIILSCRDNKVAYIKNGVSAGGGGSSFWFNGFPDNILITMSSGDFVNSSSMVYTGYLMRGGEILKDISLAPFSFAGNGGLLYKTVNYFISIDNNGKITLTVTPDSVASSEDGFTLPIIVEYKGTAYTHNINVQASIAGSYTLQPEDKQEIANLAAQMISTGFVLTDVNTNKKYKIIVENGKLTMREVN